MSTKQETLRRRDRLIRELIDDTRSETGDADEALRAYADALSELTRWLFDAALEDLPEVLGPEDFHRFASLATGGHPGSIALDRIERVFDLSETEVGGLFGISRQAVTSWRVKGIPAARQQRFNDILRITDLLELRFLPERIPGIVRTPAPAYDGRSMLQMIADGDEANLLEQLRATFDWAATA